MSVKLSSLLNSVCSVNTSTGAESFGGQGVLVMPDFLLTSWHVIEGAKNVTVTGAQGKSARVVQGSPYNRKSSSLDLAFVELTSPISSDVATFSDTTDHIREMKGFLVTMFTGKAAYHTAGLDSSRVSVDARLMGDGMPIRNFLTTVNTGPGYSGSPVFDSRGKLASVLNGRHKFTDDADFPTPKGTYSFYGPSPHRMAGFIRHCLDKIN